MTDKKVKSKNKPSEHKLPSDFNVLTFKVPCPTCGASVEFASAASIMAVCEYCQTTVVRQGEEISAQGKQSLTIEDYSSLQIGSMGVFQSVDFVIVGRVQLEYTDGIWNEWYVQFSNGHTGWLSEALGHYSLSLDKGKQDVPSYDNLAVNQRVTFQKTQYIVSDKRSALAIAGEGELPFIMGTGWQTWVIDARYKRQMITLDYSDGFDVQPTVFKGVAVSLEQLKMQLLKESEQTSEALSIGSHSDMGTLSLIDDDLINGLEDRKGFNTSNSDSSDIAPDVDNTQAMVAGFGKLGLGDSGIKDTKAESLSVDNLVSGRKKVTSDVDNTECPNCGSPVPFVAGVTNCLMCPACFSEIKLIGTKAELVNINSMMQNYVTSLKLGAKARIKEVDTASIREFSDDGDNVTETVSFDDEFVSIEGDVRVKKTPADKSEKSNPSVNNSKYHDYIVVGIQRLQEIESYSRWTEYLLYSFTDGFLWLSEEPKRGWMISRVINELPDKRGDGIYYQDRMWNNYQGFYQSRVVFAIGAFNWQVRVNDAMIITDYTSGKQVISAEQNNQEITYTIASPVKQDKIAQWFGSQLEQQTAHEDYGKYNIDNGSDIGLDVEGNGFRTIFHLLFGLIVGYLFLFFGSLGAFGVCVLMFVVGIGIIVLTTSNSHAYLSAADTASEVVSTKAQAPKIGVWVVVVFTIIINFIFFSTPSNKSGHSGGYFGYINTGKTGYSSAGRHK